MSVIVKNLRNVLNIFVAEVVLDESGVPLTDRRYGLLSK